MDSTDILHNTMQIANLCVEVHRQSIMSYNGIGLQTPRGSGTSGYVQKSLSGTKKEGLRQKRERQAQDDRLRELKAKKRLVRQGAGGEIIDHDRRRLIELKCMELRDTLEDEDVDDETVEKRVTELRRLLERERDDKRRNDLERHSLGSKKEVESEEEEEKKEISMHTQSNKKSEESNESENENPEKEMLDEVKKSEKYNSVTEKSELRESRNQSKSYSYVPRYADR